jgi:SAM-dependent methyltransferase
MTLAELQKAIGHTDLYLLDQIVKGRFTSVQRMLDAGCGEGRNMGWFLTQGVQVYGIDLYQSAVQYARVWAKSILPAFEPLQIQEGDISQLPYPDHFFDAVVCNAVLHFAKNEQQFETMWQEMVRVLRPGGILFLRFSTLHGIDYNPQPIEKNVFRLVDGSEWFLASTTTLHTLITNYRLQLVEPIKTVVIEQTRTMTTLVLSK